MRARALFVWNLYREALQSRPLATKSVTAGTLAAVSDVVCQRLETSSSLVTLPAEGTTLTDEASVVATTTDWWRTFQVGLVGLLWTGPIAHTWYNLLERLVVPITHHRVAFGARLVLDATLFSPVAVVGYFTSRALLEGGGWRAVTTKLRTSWRAALVASWHFWPLANLVNYSVVPLSLRVLYVSALGLLWQGYLSHANEKGKASVSVASATGSLLPPTESCDGEVSPTALSRSLPSSGIVG